MKKIVVVKGSWLANWVTDNIEYLAKHGWYADITLNKTRGNK